MRLITAARMARTLMITAATLVRTAKMSLGMKVTRGRAMST